MAALPEVAWPAPLPLEGVKSRKRAIFEVPLAYFKSTSDQSVNTFSGLKLTLDSRIFATGRKVSCAATELLLGARQRVTGTSSQHDSLKVVHLGPQLLGFSGQSAEEYLVAVNAALQARPHVIILDEAAASRNEGWSKAFTCLSECEAIQAFRGAVVICASAETPAIRKTCSQRWTGAGEWVWQENMMEYDGCEFLEDVLSTPGQEVLDEPFMKEVQDLAWKKPFREDLIEKVKRRGWTLTVLIKSVSQPSQNGQVQGEAPESPRSGSTTASEDEEQGKMKSKMNSKRLAGFICYMVRPEASFDIIRVAVVEQSRGLGYGRKLMQWAMEKAARMPPSHVPWIALSALDEVTPFYERFGFWDMTSDKLEDEDHFQTWMEIRHTSIVAEDVGFSAPPLA